MRMLYLVTMVFMALAIPARSAPSPQPMANSPSPNIVVILTDDLGWGDISLHGNRLIETPNIDRIGHEGVSMSQFYAGSNVCSPSRAALLTGRYPPRTGMQFVTRPHSDWGMSPDEITIAEILRGRGYATGMIGKWHLGHRAEYWPTNQGFDSFLGVAYSNDMKPFDLYREMAIVDRDIDQTTLAATYSREAVRFLQANQDRPFFLYLADNFPHIPLFHPPESDGRSAAGEYGDTVETMDDMVGSVLDALDRLNLSENTLVIFTSDNGPWFQGDAGPWRSRKGGTYDGGYRVPFLARWPASIPAGKVNAEMAMAIDLMPTLADLAGATVPKDRTIDGRNIASMWTENATSPHELLYFFDGNELAAVRDARFKLQLKDYYRTFAVPFRAYGGARMFDLQLDPQERYDVSKRHEAKFTYLMTAAANMDETIAPLKSDPGPLMPPEGSMIGPKLD